MYIPNVNLSSVEFLPVKTGPSVSTQTGSFSENDWKMGLDWTFDWTMGFMCTYLLTSVYNFGTVMIPNILQTLLQLRTLMLSVPNQALDIVNDFLKQQNLFWALPYFRYSWLIIIK